MIIDPNLATKIQDCVEQLENNVKTYSDQIPDQPEKLRRFFKKEILDRFAEIRECVAQLNGGSFESSKEEVFPFMFFVVRV
jgi:hypothetical protein